MRAQQAATTLVAVGVTGWAARRVLTRRAARNSPAAEQSHWRFVTVNVAPEQVRPFPQPLRELDAEIVVRPAPGGRGTEIGVRLNEGEPTGAKAAAQRFAGTDPRQAVRKALRDAKQLLETGEILSPDRPGTNTKTLTGKPLELAIAHAKGEGKQ
ncbi:hypothetical protein [Cryptosporangium sp. NPDC048952]|uniref:hypothetical protein n=1 Tax=Cryptosporangium sp. NPDC048952 TaxID=3363961 RepID=UPI00371608B3